jgi:hypothetical protein
MAGEKRLESLLKNMSPKLNREEYVFLTLDGQYGDYIELDPICSFMEEEGLTLVVPKKNAILNNLKINDVFRAITLTVHSSLDAVGLTTAVSSKLSSAGISANVVAAYHHDHIFVQSKLAEKAMESLEELIRSQP